VSTESTGTVMYAVAIIGFIALMASLFMREIDEQRNPNRTIETVSTSDGGGAIVLERNRFGHYVASAWINGVEAECMLDTGATDVAVSAALARAAGLRPGAALTVSTANGVTTAYATVIDEIRLGNLVMRDVRASIVPRLDDGQVLLGMSVLGQLDFAQRGEQLILAAPAPAGGP
jgi:aspartyl protease family protein